MSSANAGFYQKMVVVGVLYFAEGLPYGFLFKTLTYYLATLGVSLKAIGLAGLLHVPWMLKFIWAPLVDRFGRRAVWIVTCQGLIALAMFAVPGSRPGGVAFFALLTLMAAAGATQDIAIDGYTIDILDDKEMGPANGIRLTTYRVALIAAGGLFVWLSDYLGWSAVFVVMAACMGLSALFIVAWPPAHQPRPPAASAVRDSIREVLRQAWGGLGRLPYLWAAVLFILLFKAGDAFLGPMVGPFWYKSGFSAAQYGLVSGTFGTVLSIAGSLIGGWLCRRWPLGRALWVLGALQALSNLGYALAAWWVQPEVLQASPAPPPPGLSQMAFVFGASAVESFTGGLGNAPFLTLLMLICNRKVSGAQYAALSAIFALSGTVAAAFSGYAAQSWGFASFFMLSFVVALPAFGLLPWVVPMASEQGRRAVVGLVHKRLNVLALIILAGLAALLAYKIRQILLAAL